MMSFDELVDQFLTTLQAGNRADTTLSWYADMLTVYKRWLITNELGGHWLESSTLERYFADSRNEVSKATVHGRYRALRRFYKWLTRRHLAGLGIKNPMIDVEAPTLEHKLPRQAKPDHVQRLFSHLETPGDERFEWVRLRDRAILAVFAYGGLRKSEVANLQDTDLDLRCRLLRVRKGKRDKERMVPMPAELVDPIQGYLAARPDMPDLWPALWFGHDGWESVRGVLRVGGIDTMIERRCKEAGITHQNPHSFRHAYAAGLLARNADISLVSQLMGHTDIHTTKRFYGTLQGDQLRQAFDRVWMAAD